MGRTLIMGDIHGNFHAMEQCLERCSFEPGKDVLVQLGDVSDRHSDTVKVVEKLLTIPNLIAIRGNHDQWTLQWLESGIEEPAWLINGGQETLDSYRSSSEEIALDLHLQFFEEKQVLHHVDEKNRLFVHGGFTHPKGPAYDPEPTLCLWDRTMWARALDGHQDDNKPAILNGFSEIYIGHTPTLNWFKYEPMNAFNVWNLDTGAGTTGKLTIMDADTKEFWQSDFANKFYPTR